MIQIAYEFLAKLRLLTLAGQEGGELLWIGPNSAWRELHSEEESILRDAELAKI